MSLFKRAVGVGAGVTSVALLMAASPANGAGSAPQPRVLALAGSETTEVLDGTLANSWNSSTPGFGVVNVPVLPTSPFLLRAGSADPAAVVDQTFTQPPVVAPNFKAPNGSSDGVNAVAGTNAYATLPLGTVDIGRSSRDYLSNGVNGGAGDANGLEFWAFARDGVTWGTKSLQAPAAITADTLRQIYLGLTTNWSQVPGGGSGPIKRYLAQANSGTEVTFETKVLGFAPPTGIPGLSDPVRVEENRGTAIAAADRESAVYPYSLGKWAFQYTNRVNPTIDVRDGTKPGAFCTPASSAGSVASTSCAGISAGTPNVQVGLTYVTAGTGSYLLNANVITDANATPGTGLDQGIGARYLYHVLNPAHEATSYEQARLLVGTNAAAGTLSAGGFASTIRGQGFLTIGNGLIGDPRNAAATGQVRFFNTKVSA